MLRLHAKPVVTQHVVDFAGLAFVFLLDLETASVDVASDGIWEIACLRIPSDPRANGAAFSTAVRASAEDTAFHFCRISDERRATIGALRDFIDWLRVALMRTKCT